MRSTMKQKMMSVVLSGTMVLGVMALPAQHTPKVQAASGTDMGYYYVASGQPAVFQDKKAKTIKIISKAGNKCTVTKNKIKIICKKSGEIKYKADGKKKHFRIIIGGNGKDTKVKRSEYKMLPDKVKGKKYTNFIDGVHAYMKTVSSPAAYNIEKNKKTVNKAAKYNRGIKYGTDLETIKEKYPSWQDVGTWGKRDCVYTAKYYDKKTGLVVEKGFILDKKSKVIGYVYYAVKANKEIIQLKH